MSKTGGFALAPLTMRSVVAAHRRAVEPECSQERHTASPQTSPEKGDPVRPRYHTPALRDLSTNWVDGSQRGDGYSHGTRLDGTRVLNRFALLWG
jgi:hypothetical protein